MKKLHTQKIVKFVQQAQNQVLQIPHTRTHSIFFDT
jgi:hypothetical protein